MATETQLFSLNTLLRELSNDLKSHRSEMKTSINNLEEKIDGIATRISVAEKKLENCEVKTNTNTEDIKANNEDILANKETNDNLKTLLASLQKENETLANDLDDQIDRQMRETLMIDGVPGNERAWCDTKRHLAQYLSDIKDEMNDNVTSASYQDIYSEIVRAHRGTKGKKR